MDPLLGKLYVVYYGLNMQFNCMLDYSITICFELHFMESSILQNCLGLVIDNFVAGCFCTSTATAKAVCLMKF